MLYCAPTESEAKAGSGSVRPGGANAATSLRQDLLAEVKASDDFSFNPQGDDPLSNTVYDLLADVKASEARAEAVRRTLGLSWPPSSEGGGGGDDVGGGGEAAAAPLAGAGDDVSC